MNLRTGQGIDFHRLAEGRELWLGGVLIPSDFGCIAHSDGDVLIHAVCDAMLGAAGLGDIGCHFPDIDPEYKNIDSKILLERTSGIISRHGFRLVNIDSTVCLEKPKIAAYIPDMRTVMASILGTTPDNISVKATTAEKLGFIGRGEGVAAYAIALLEK